MTESFAAGGDFANGVDTIWGAEGPAGFDADADVFGERADADEEPGSGDLGQVCVGG